MRSGRQTTKLERYLVFALGAWLALAVIQIPFSGDLINGLEGFRLVQFYVVAGIGGILLAARLPDERLATALLVAIGVVSSYAAIRGVIGPSDNEVAFVEERNYNTVLGEATRASGSFTSPIALASYLVPAAVFSLVLAFLMASRRTLGLADLRPRHGRGHRLLRSNRLVAIVAGIGALIALLLSSPDVSRRRRAYAIALTVVVLVGGYGAVLAAGTVDEAAKERADSLRNPFADESVKDRFSTWGDSLEKVAEKPQGTGLGSVGRATLEEDGRDVVYTDSSYIKILQEQGVLGGLLFLVGILGVTSHAGEGWPPSDRSPGRWAWPPSPGSRASSC